MYATKTYGFLLNNLESGAQYILNNLIDKWEDYVNNFNDEEIRYEQNDRETYINQINDLFER